MRARSKLAIAMVLSLASSASAVVLETEPFARPVPGGLVCRAANRSLQEQRMRIEALDARGLATYDTGRFTLAPGAMFLSGVGHSARRCRFRIAGEGQGIRASALVVAREPPLVVQAKPVVPPDRRAHVEPPR